jgi:hypothetical protein
MYQQGLGCTGVLREYTPLESQRLVANGWRLPTKDELLTLIDKRRVEERRDPYLNEMAFPQVRRDREIFLTSTSGGSVKDLNDRVFPGAACVDFGLAVAEACGAYPVSVRLVRDRR